MSLEAALDEERREVLNILEGRSTLNRGAGNGQNSSGQTSGIRSSAPTVRSMLDIGEASAPKHASSAAQTPRNAKQNVRSMLDFGADEPTRGAPKMPSSLQPFHNPGSALHRPTAPDPRPRAPNEREGVDPSTDYQFSMLPSIPNRALPKRVTQGWKQSRAPITQGNELGSSQKGRDGGRYKINTGIGGGSKSPSSRAFNRSQSPGIGLMRGLVPSQGKYVTETGKVFDMSTAYRKLNDAAFLNAGGGLSNLPLSTAAGRAAAEKGEILSPSGEVRLREDYYPAEGDGDEAGESSDEGLTGGYDDEHWGQSGIRGRRRGRQRVGIEGRDVGTEGPELGVYETEGMIGLGKTPGPRETKSLLAAAEEERIEVTSRQRAKSLLDGLEPATGPSGEKMSAKKSGVRPSTNYDQTTSPTTSDNEEISDIQAAQQLGIYCSPIDRSVPDRASRTMLRGDFLGIQQEAADSSRRPRTYLVATDLSSEAAYALEWTIGSVLRDGDTLLAVYAVDEEAGTGRTGDAESVPGLPPAEGAVSMQETPGPVGKKTVAVQNDPSMLGPPSHASDARRSSSRTSPDSSDSSKPQHERLQAVEGITVTCIKFLRKTKLQVRVGIEVIHCKSPKHMIMEAIDGLEPTLVVVGSRGRSALKGVLLGSFSNYLVTKSSVPVMVARRRFMGRRITQPSPKITLTNNLTTTNVPFSWEPVKVD